MSNRAVVVELTPGERKALEALAGSRTAPFRQVQRARLILLAAGGATNTQISQEVDLSRSMVARWRERFVRHRLDGLTDQPRPGRPRVYAEADRLRVVEAACNGRPPDSTQWSVRSLAKATGVGRDTVHKILREHKLKPHRIGTFSHSPDPDFVAKVVDVVGLYLDPPENAVVVCVDEKTQVQALDRRQPMLPMRPGQIERRTHDYKRNGTVQLFAALEVHAGRVIPRIEDRHRSREFLAFMNHLLQAYPSGEIHVILDNVITHRSKEVQAWHAKFKHQRVVFHFLPTYSSWLNLIEVLFSLVEANVIRRGVFPTKDDLVEKILAYIDRFNHEGRPFRWTKTAGQILRSLSKLTRH